MFRSLRLKRQPDVRPALPGMLSGELLARDACSPISLNVYPTVIEAVQHYA